MAGNVTRPARNAIPKADSERNNDATLMLLSKTGAGKSSLGNVILNLAGQDGFAVTNGLCATEIYEAVAKEATVHGRKIRVVDTPGVMDTNFERKGNEEKVLSGICDGIVLCPEGVDAFLIVMRMDARMTQEEFEAVAKLETLFGAEFWRYVILVFTRGDHVANDARQLAEALSESRTRIATLDGLISKLKTEPLLFDASGNGDPDVVDEQKNRLRSAVDQLMRENKRKYTNKLFDVVQTALSGPTNAELIEKQRLADFEVQQLKQQVERLEKDKQADFEVQQLKQQVERLEKDKQAEAKNTIEIQRKLENAEKRARNAEEKVRKMEEEAKRKAEQEAKKFCTFL